jgi:hypothetical protein
MVAVGHVLVLAQEPLRSPWADLRLLAATLALVAALLVGALVIALVDRWRKRSPDDRISPGDQLSQFRLLYEQGQLSKEEFERIRGRLGRQLRDELDLPDKPPPASPPEAPPPAPAP